MLKLSPSSLNIFLECPRCFWLYVNKNTKRPSIPVATITTGLDRVIKEYFDLFRTKDILPPLLEGKVPGRLIRNLPHKGWLEFIDNKIDAKLGGYLDECLDLGNNFYAALDHKTRGSKPESTHPAHQFQMDAYTFLLEQNRFPTKNLAYLVYYIPKSVASKEAIDFEAVACQIKTEPQRARKVFYDAISLLKQSIPLAHKDCEFCKWTATADIK
jgi:CRISPR/Cas system-associated exonuclease Cas4 (RecB family)